MDTNSAVVLQKMSETLNFGSRALILSLDFVIGAIILNYRRAEWSSSLVWTYRAWFLLLIFIIMHRDQVQGMKLLQGEFQFLRGFI